MTSSKAIIVSAPSGSGKTTIVKYLLNHFPALKFSISATSRTKRPNEKDGHDYYFLTEMQFRRKIREDAFIEWEEVYEGVFYGSLKSEIQRIWETGSHVIFDVDVQGGIRLKKYFGEKALALFIGVTSVEVLRSRLKDRKTETKESLEKRISKAEYEMTFRKFFDTVIINDILPDSCARAGEKVQEFLNQ